MDLSSSSPQPSTDFIDLMNNQEQKHRISDNGFDSMKEEIVPSYDFQPIRPSTAALDLAGATTTSTAARVNYSDFKPISTSP